MRDRTRHETTIRTLERELERAHRYEIAFKQSARPIYLLDRDGSIVEANPASNEYATVESDDLDGSPFWSPGVLAKSAEEAGELKDFVEAVITGNRIGERIRSVTDDGALEVTATPITDVTGEVAYVLVEANSLDRDHSIKGEATVHEVDQLAAYLAHELHNPLSVARGYLELAREETDISELEHVEAALERMDQLIEGMDAFALNGKDLGERRPITLEAVADEAWSAIETADATLVVDGNLTIEADRSKLRQVFENLFRNAVEHGGTDVAIRVGTTPIGFFIEDDGDGLGEMDPAAIFDLGVSGSSHGTGFGLAIVSRIVDAHGWEIEAMDADDGGARFEITTKSTPST